MNIFVCQKNFCAKSSVPRPLSGERTLARGPERTARWPRLPGFWPFNRERPIRYQKIFPCQPQTAKFFRIAFPRSSAERNAVLRVEGGKKNEFFSHTEAPRARGTEEEKRRGKFFSRGDAEARRKEEGKYQTAKCRKAQAAKQGWGFGQGCLVRGAEIAAQRVVLV